MNSLGVKLCSLYSRLYQTCKNLEECVCVELGVILWTSSVKIKHEVYEALNLVCCYWIVTWHSLMKVDTCYFDEWLRSHRQIVFIYSSGSQPFSARVPPSIKKKKIRVPLVNCDKAVKDIFNVNLKLPYPLRFLTYPWGYAYPRLGTAALECYVLFEWPLIAIIIMMKI